MIWVFVAAAAGVLIAIVGVWWVRHYQLDATSEEQFWQRLDAHCLKCNSEWVKVFISRVAPMKVGDAVECPACGATGVVTKL